MLTDPEAKTTLFNGPLETKLPGGNGTPPVLPPVNTGQPSTAGGNQGKRRSHDRRSWILAVCGAVAVIGLLAISLYIEKRPNKPPAKTTTITEIPSSSAPTASSVTVHSNQPNAEIYVDGQVCGTGQCQLPLAPGSHQIEARLSGFENATTTVDVKSGEAVAPVELALTAQAPVMTVDTNLAPASVQVDDTPPVSVQDGEAQIKDLAAGQHAIHFKGEQYSVTFNLTMAPGKAAEIQPLTRQPIWVAIGSAMGSDAKIVSNMLGAQIAIDGKDSGRLDKNELDLPGLTPGQHEITLTLPTGAVQHLRIASGPVPQVSRSCRVLTRTAARSRSMPAKRTRRSTSTARRCRGRRSREVTTTRRHSPPACTR